MLLGVIWERERERQQQLAAEEKGKWMYITHSSIERRQKRAAARDDR
jgi:hypothetical protein